MKRFTFDIPDYVSSTFFGPIRGKGDVILVQMNAIKHMLVNRPVSSHKSNNKLKMHLIVSKMNRLFFESEDKHYSISFPFNSVLNEGYIFFSNNYLTDVDSKVTSDVIALINDDTFISGNIMYDFIDGLNEEIGNDHKFWNFILQLFLSECGYIRFDHDKERQEAVFHPENHFDIFYSQYSTWKVGLKDKLSIDDFINHIDNDYNCQYFENAKP